MRGKKIDTEESLLEKKKLCLVIPSLQAGGMERVMSELLWYFSTKDKVELSLILYGIKREIFYPIPEGIQVYKPTFKFNNTYRFYFTIKTVLYLRNVIKKIDPATILSFGEYWNNFVLLSTIGLGYPVFVSDRSQPDKSLGIIQDKLRQLLYPKAKGLILQTDKAKEIYLQKNKHNNIGVIGNPIRNISNRGSEVKKEKNVLMVGRLIESKHQDLLIEIFAKVSPPDWKLLLVGYDHLGQSHLERLKQLAKNLRVDQQVIFMGKQDNVDDIYHRSAIFAFTSSSEGFPNVIGEAMSAGLPVIAFDCVAGPSEMIIDGENGFLVPLFEKELFESKLKLLIENEDLRKKFGLKSIENIKRFSTERICEDFFRFITK